MKPLFLFLSVCLFGMLISTSCKKTLSNASQRPVDSVTTQKPVDSLSILKVIDSVTILKADSTAFTPGEVAIERFSGDSILISVPPFTDITNLIPVFSFRGITISPASRVRQNFSSPLTYTVTAKDSSQKKYTVVVSQRGIVYFGGSDKNFYAVDALKGKLLWKTPGGDFSYSDPVLVNGIIYTGNIDYNIYAIDATTGSIKWSFPTDFTIESPPAVANGTVYFGNDKGHFYALDASTGLFKWQFNAYGNISARPVVLNNVVYFSSDDSYVYALNAASGALIWKYQSGGQFNASSPVIDNGTLYVGNRDGNLYALDIITGMLKWKFNSGGISLEMSRPIVSNGIVYIGGWYNFSDFTKPGGLYAVDGATGSLKWHALDSLGIGSDPAIGNGQIYVTCDDGYLYGVDLTTHSFVWRSRIYANGASPAVSGSIVYCGGGGTRNFYAFDAKSGAPRWQLPIQNALTTSTPVVAGRTSF